MIHSPIHKVLLTLKKYNVQALLSGGQACILYGAAEFSRDTDFVILASPANIEALRKALRTLKAERIFLPPSNSTTFSEDMRAIFAVIIPPVKACAWLIPICFQRSPIALG